jgi:2,4-dienoyl-CoA reductase-like NADH-dependent reductase (Old Yellow Enzyme family)
MRFAAEVARQVRKRWPEGKPLFFRTSAVDETGWTIDHSIALAKVLKANGVDVIDCSSGGMSDLPPPSETVPAYGYQVPYAREIRAGADIMTMAVGMIVHSDHADEIVNTGSADLVALGRELLHNPHWPIDAAQKLRVESPFSEIPRAYAYWLEKRSKSNFGKPSTFQTGMRDDKTGE